MPTTLFSVNGCAGSIRQISHSPRSDPEHRPLCTQSLPAHSHLGTVHRSLQPRSKTVPPDFSNGQSGGATRVGQSLARSAVHLKGEVICEAPPLACIGPLREASSTLLGGRGPEWHPSSLFYLIAAAIRAMNLIPLKVDWSERFYKQSLAGLTNEIKGMHNRDTPPQVAQPPRPIHRKYRLLSRSDSSRLSALARSLNLNPSRSVW